MISRLNLVGSLPHCSTGTGVSGAHPSVIAGWLRDGSAAWLVVDAAVHQPLSSTAISSPSPSLLLAADTGGEESTLCHLFGSSLTIQLM